MLIRLPKVELWSADVLLTKRCQFDASGPRRFATLILSQELIALMIVPSITAKFTKVDPI